MFLTRDLIYFVDLSYAMPLGARIIGALSGRSHKLEGPYSLGKYSLPLNVISFIFLLFASITFNFPTCASIDYIHHLSDTTNFCIN